MGGQEGLLGDLGSQQEMRSQSLAALSHFYFSRHCDRKECPVYYLSRVITGLGTGYSVVEGHYLTLLFVTQKLRHYFMSFTVHIVIRCDPIKHLMSRAILYSWGELLDDSSL
ncbi:ty3-gypsy retrotransposon protein [Tanacetum coccineum]